MLLNDTKSEKSANSAAQFTIIPLQCYQCPRRTHNCIISIHSQEPRNSLGIPGRPQCFFRVILSCQLFNTTWNTHPVSVTSDHWTRHQHKWTPTSTLQTVKEKKHVSPWCVVQKHTGRNTKWEKLPKHTHKARKHQTSPCTSHVIIDVWRDGWRVQ